MSLTIVGAICKVYVIENIRNIVETLDPSG